MKFSDINTPGKTGSGNALVITKQAHEPLSKQQQAFNKYIKKIEKLQLELTNTINTLNEKLAYYGKQVHPIEQKLIRMRKEVVKLLFTFIDQKKFFSKTDKENLREFISVQLNEILVFEKTLDEELENIFAVVKGSSFEDFSTLQFEEMKNGMESMFENMGYDVDLGELHKNMSEEEMIRKLKSIQEEFKEAGSKKDKKNNAEKTKKQVERERKEQLLSEARQKNISTIYRQLAKVLHPDLEQDEEQRAHKEVLMKQLTVAYNNNDMHTLLRLEMEWIHKEEQHAGKLSEEKLALYNETLKEQVEHLQDEINAIKQHPRYQPIMRFNKYFSGLSINLKEEKANMKAASDSMQKSVIALRGPNGLKEVKEILADYELQKTSLEFMDLLFSN